MKIFSALMILLSAVGFSAAAAAEGKFGVGLAYGNQKGVADPVGSIKTKPLSLEAVYAYRFEDNNFGVRLIGGFGSGAKTASMGAGKAVEEGKTVGKWGKASGKQKLKYYIHVMPTYHISDKLWAGVGYSIVKSDLTLSFTDLVSIDEDGDEAKLDKLTLKEKNPSGMTLGLGYNIGDNFAVSFIAGGDKRRLKQLSATYYF